MKAVWYSLCRTLQLLLFCLLLQQTVCAQLHADFTATPAAGCAPVYVQFNDISTGGPSSWKWDLGNGTVSFLQHPSTTYFNPGKYSIKLVVKRGNLADSVVKVNTIIINALPKAAFKVSDTTGCYPLNVHFTDQSQAQEGSIVKWEWDFGDGTLSSAQHPDHVYSGPGNYNIILRVTNTAGCVTTVSKAQYIKIKDGVKADYSFTGSTLCTPPSLIRFTNKSTGTGTLSYQWAFGDGHTSNQQDPVNTYLAAGLYTIRLVVTNTAGCIDTLVKKDSISVGVAHAAFTIPDTICERNTVKFVNSSQPATGKLFWNFGDGNTSADINPVNIYNTAGNYKVTLVADFGSCKDSVSKPVTVIARAASAFTANKTATCKAPFTVQFNNQTTSGSSFQWLFGDGSSSTAQHPSHTYQQNGEYDVTLISTNSAGCSDTLTQQRFIQVLPAEIKIQGLPLTGCIPLVFTPAYVVKSVIPITQYNWDFGDGSSSNIALPSHAYNKPGLYTVTLTYTTADGCSNTIVYKDAVKLGEKPVANFTANPTNTCASTPITFTDNSSGNVTNWFWSFGDGITDSNRNPIHLYNDTGYFGIQLIASNNGCADTLRKAKYIYIKPPVAKFAPDVRCADPFHYTFTNYSVGASTFNWTFGDGSSSTDKDPVHTYSSTGTYMVKLTVTNGSCTHTAAYGANVVLEKANFVADRTVVCKGDSVSLISQGFNSGKVIAYRWYTDAGVDTARNIKIAYNSTGLHTVMLVITNSNGCTDTLIRKDYIRVNGPTANFTAVNSAACLNKGGQIQFTDAAGTDGLHNITKWDWQFGDGTAKSFSSGPFAHTYAAEGAYTVLLKVTDASGCSDSISKENSIYIAKPVAAFSSNDTMSCQNRPVTFINASQGNALQYSWSFGDASTGTEPNPTHAYAGTGLYTTGLKVVDAYGCEDALTKTAYIRIDAPLALFTLSDSTSTCPPLVVNFTNHSTYFQQINWDFGDGTGALTDNPVHYYNYPGIYRPRLIVTSPGGCTDTIYRKIDIKGPTGSFVYDKTASCNPGTVGFTATTQNAQSIIWDFNDGGTRKTSSNQVSHEYNALGIYIPKMILEDARGCKVPIAGKDTIRIFGVTAGFSSDRQLLCDNGIIRFADNSVSNDLITGYQWLLGDGSSSTDKDPAHTYASTGRYNVKLVVTTLNGCTDSIGTTAPIQVVNSPRVAMRGSFEACVPASLQFYGDITVQDTSTLAWNWNFNGNKTSNAQNPQPVNYPQEGNYTTTLAVTSSNGCITTINKTVVIHPLPKVNAGNNTAICEKKTATLEATGADTYTWSPSLALSCTGCASPVAAPDSTLTYRVQGRTLFGCTATDSVIITVKHPFKIHTEKGDTLCKGEQFRLLAKNAELFEWTPSAGLDNNKIASPVARPQQTTDYRVVGKDDAGCYYDTSFVRLVVYGYPVVDAGADKTIAVGSSIELKATVSKDATAIKWQPGTGLSCTNCPNPVANPKQSTVYSLMAINDGGCVNKDEVSVFVVCNNGNIFLPNTFSPNGNGTNDVFYPRGTGLYNIKSMRIFNRWGEPVYESTNFKANDASRGWDGSFRGKPAPNDVYVYFVEVICENNSVLMYSGNIALIR